MPNRVLVLGAGFTRSFFDDAPLLIGDVAGTLLTEFTGRAHAMRVLETERTRHNGNIDLESLMTRLDAGMPYDLNHDADAELRVLGRAVRRLLLKLLNDVRKQDGKLNELKALAKKCIADHITCISFNYDEFFDEQLFKATPLHNGERDPFSWCPERGYGFVLRPSDFDYVLAIDGVTDTSMHLLKLHGSLNWRLRLGAQPPYRLDDLVHYSKWKWESSLPPQVLDGALEREPFIVPPVLTKSQLAAEPVLRAVWTSAYGYLEKAEEVVFIGYSLPATDIAARFLFSEALRNLAHDKLSVVNKVPAGEGRARLMESYRRLFPRIPDANFHWDGALPWCEQFCRA